MYEALPNEFAFPMITKNENDNINVKYEQLERRTLMNGSSPKLWPVRTTTTTKAVVHEYLLCIATIY